jgi:hypothetical protein
MLPTDRNTTYSPTDPVLSPDLNDIQDQIILLGAGGFDDVRIHRWDTGNASSNTVGATVACTINIATGESRWEITATNAYVRIACHGLKENDVIHAIGIRATTLAASGGEVRFWRKTSAAAAPVPFGTVFTLGASATENGNPPSQVLASPYTVTANDEIYAIANAPAGTMYLYHVCGSVSHPSVF